MTAKEMFEKLKFKKEEDKKFIVYTRKIGLVYLQIMFNKKGQEIDANFNSISLQELQAINKQVEELGWCEDD